MRIAAVHDAGSCTAEGALTSLVETLQARGKRIVGAVQHTVPATEDRNKRMDLRLLPSGETVTISAELPPGTPGCVLDHDVFESVGHRISESIADGFDVAVLSKFGLRETEGRGLREAIVRVAEHGLPLVIGVAPLRIPAFEEFLGVSPEHLPADIEALIAWLDSPQT